ncbi:MAG: TetR/AcrR family transcriptional regulator [Deltaproteobacteria bacterium]|nr:TetR/AcrR family transcriptional regulator [Deltaproteobacteria bacterium]
MAAPRRPARSRAAPAAAPAVPPARQQAILAAAALVFARYGFKKTSMDDLARAVGLSRQGLYLHFPTKEALFKAAMLGVEATMRAAGRAALADEAAPIEDRLLAMFEAVEGQIVGQIAVEHMTELLETATALLGPVLVERTEAIVAEVARALRAAGVMARWKDGTTAKDLAEHLCATSYGIKHRVATREEYRARMRLAIRLACATPGS